MADIGEGRAVVLAARRARQMTALGMTLLLIVTVVAVTATPVTGAGSSRTTRGYPILEARFGYAAERHTGEARFGTTGTIEKNSELSRADLGPVCRKRACVLAFDYEFGDAADPEEFAGFFVSLGRIAIDTVNPDGTEGPAIDLHDDGHFDFTDLMVNAEDDGVSIESIRFVFDASMTTEALTLKIELEDRTANRAFTRRALVPSRRRQVMDVPLVELVAPESAPIDLTAVKLVSVVVEERHVGDRVENPSAGAFAIDSITLIDAGNPPLSAARLRSLPRRQFIEELARHDFEAMMRFRDAATGASLDRTLFRDLIQWGGTGWLLAALPAAIQQGWISEEDGREAGLEILQFAARDELWCDEPSGCLGNSIGLIYRFGGIDPSGLFGPLTGTRKIDLGDTNTAEASVIDTALFQFGAATFAAGFAADPQIQTLVDSILNRTRWDLAQHEPSGQLHLSWKPALDDSAPDYYLTPAEFGGYWASRDATGTEPLTIDFWTDEGGLAAILAAGSELHGTGAGPFYAMAREKRRVRGRDVVVTFPGAWFTSSFLTATYLDPRLGTDARSQWGVPSVDWTANGSAVFECMRRADRLPGVVLADAVELPDTTYRAQGFAPCAVDQTATFSGTVSPYSLQLATGLDRRTAARAIAQLRRIVARQPHIWDPTVGLLDAFHPELARFSTDAALIRSTGPWIQQQVWPLNKGAALIAQLNYLDNGVVWRTANSHPVIDRGIATIYGT